MDIKNSALILEGGALRSFFTCGVLDVLMENDIYFPTVCGVSAGSLCAISYISKQIGRTAKVNLDFVNDKRYLSIHSLIHDKMLFNFDFLFGEISHSLIPLDYDTFFANEQNLVAFTTDCKTGRSVTFEKSKGDDILLACRASSSMPIVSKIVEIEGEEYLDGGLSMPIPYQWALDKGYDKVVLILTRDINYRKSPISGIAKRVYSRTYKNYPDLLKSIFDIPERYNLLAKEIIGLEKQGKIFVIRPEEPVKVKRTEKDTEKLRELYNIGRSIGEKQLDSLIKYLEQ